MTIDFFYKALITLLVSVKIYLKYYNFFNIFSLFSMVKQVKPNTINNYLIYVLEEKQLLYRLIYYLKLRKPRILKTYIKVNLTSRFINSSKSLASTLILFVLKKKSSLHLYVDCQKLNNLIIKNCYLLLFIRKLLNYSSCNKDFT